MLLVNIVFTGGHGWYLVTCKYIAQIHFHRYHWATAEHSRDLCPHLAIAIILTSYTVRCMWYYPTLHMPQIWWWSTALQGASWWCRQVLPMGCEV